MAKRDLLSVHAASKTVLVMYQEMCCSGIGAIKYWLADELDQVANYDVIKNFKRALFAIDEVVGDVRTVYCYTGDLLEKEILDRVQKALRIDKAQIQVDAEEWAIEWVNEMAISIESTAVAFEDLIELIVDVDTTAIAAQVKNLQQGPKILRDFRDGSFTEILRAIDAENILPLKDKVVEVPDPAPTEEDPMEEKPQLLIQLGHPNAQRPAKLQQKSMDAFDPTKSRIEFIETDSGPLINEQGQEMHKVKLEFKAAPQNEIDAFQGIATGIVIPAGRPDRTYLDGDFFPAEIVTFAMYDFMLNAPRMNKGHDQKDMHFYWEHPDFRVLETWQCRQPFLLNGLMVEQGDWVMTIIAISPEFKQQMKEGQFNGFSIEAWIAYVPDHLMARQ